MWPSTPSAATGCVMAMKECAASVCNLGANLPPMSFLLSIFKNSSHGQKVGLPSAARSFAACVIAAPDRPRR